MRKLLVAVMVLALVVVAKTDSFAAFTSMSISSITASVSFAGNGVVNVSAVFSAGSALSWTGVSVGTTKWQAADQYIILHSTITDSTGGIRMYTNNKNAAVVAERYTGTGDPAGLVNLGLTTETLPMAWRVVATSTGTQTIVESADNHLYVSQLGGIAGGYPVYLWMMDKGTSGFSNTNPYLDIRDSVLGIQHAEATWGAGVPSPVAVYFAANFQTARTPATYKTSTLVIEAYHD